MKKLETKIEYMNNYSVMMIRKEDVEYIGYVLKYDGNIFKDIQVADAQIFMNQFSNIKGQLEQGFSYHLVYNFDYHKYQSSIILPNKKRKYKSITQEEILEDFTVLGDSILDSMIELEHKIEKQQTDKNMKQKKL